MCSLQLLVHHPARFSPPLTGGPSSSSHTLSRVCRAPITPVQLGGYAVTFCGIVAYNYLKAQQGREAEAAKQAAAAAGAAAPTGTEAAAADGVSAGASCW